MTTETLTSLGLSPQSQLIVTKMTLYSSLAQTKPVIPVVLAQQALFLLQNGHSLDNDAIISLIVTDIQTHLLFSNAGYPPMSLDLHQDVNVNLLLTCEGQLQRLERKSIRAF